MKVGFGPEAAGIKVQKKVESPAQSSKIEAHKDGMVKHSSVPAS
jgi:hypothetical protein